MSRQENGQKATPMRVIDEETFNFKEHQLEKIKQKLEELHRLTVDNLQLLRDCQERLERHVGELLRFVAVQGPAGLKLIEKMNQADPDMAAFAETAFRRVRWTRKG